MIQLQSINRILNAFLFDSSPSGKDLAGLSDEATADIPDFNFTLSDDPAGFVHRVYWEAYFNERNH